MTQYLVLVLVALTSCVAYALGAARLGLSRTSLRAALERALECVGLSLVFLVVNLVAGVLLVLAVRVLTRAPLSLYLVADETLPILSFLQGLALAYRRDHSAQISGSVSGPRPP